MTTCICEAEVTLYPTLCRYVLPNDGISLARRARERQALGSGQAIGLGGEDKIGFA